MYVLLRSTYTWQRLSISVLAEPGVDALCWTCCKDLLFSQAWTRQPVARSTKRLELLVYTSNMHSVCTHTSLVFCTIAVLINPNTTNPSECDDAMCAGAVEPYSSIPSNVAIFGVFCAWNQTDYKKTTWLASRCNITHAIIRPNALPMCHSHLGCKSGCCQGDPHLASVVKFEKKL